MNETMNAIEKSIRANAFASANRNTSKTIKNTRTRAKYHAQLSELGLIPDYNGNQTKFETFVQYYNMFKITTEQLPALRKVFSELKDEKDYAVQDAEKRLIQVRLSCGTEADAAMKFFYVTELPPDAKCKIVKNSYDSIACDL